jgi:hypothetical protein
MVGFTYSNFQKNQEKISAVGGTPDAPPSGGPDLGGSLGCHRVQPIDRSGGMFLEKRRKENKKP